MIRNCSCVQLRGLAEAPATPAPAAKESPFEAAGRLVMILGAVLIAGAFVAGRRRSKYD